MTAVMRAAMYDRYGPPSSVEVREVPIPQPDENEVVVKVAAAGANPLDLYLLTGTPYIARPSFGLFRPKHHTPGADVAGTVHAVGSNVTEFAVGDEVWGESTGSFAEFAVSAAAKLVPRPETLSFEHAAAVNVAAITALQALRDQADVQPGQRVLVNGASGGVGTYAVQLARWLGADVTGVCSGRNVELVESLGAHTVVDYTSDDPLVGHEPYDVIIDNVGSLSFSASRRAMTRRGVFVLVGAPKTGRFLGPVRRLIRAVAVNVVASQKLTSFVAEVTAEDLGTLNELLAAGELRSVIDTTYALDDVVAALTHLATGRARGKIVVTP